MTHRFDLEYRRAYLWTGAVALFVVVVSLLLLSDGPPRQPSKFAWAVLGSLLFGLYFTAVGWFVQRIELSPEFITFEPIGVRIALCDLVEITEVIQPYDFVSVIELRTRLDKKIWVPSLFLNTKGKALLHMRHVDGAAFLEALEAALANRPAPS